MTTKMPLRCLRCNFSWIQIITALVIVLILWEGIVWKIVQENTPPTSSAITSEPALDFHNAITIVDLNFQETWDSYWKEVKSSQGRIFLFSAYLDTRNSPVVRIIGVLRQKRTAPLYCHLISVASKTSGSVSSARAVLSMHKEAWSLKYSSYFIDCVLPKDFHKENQELFVCVSEDKKFSSWNSRLRVRQLKVREKPKESTFAVCVKPMHYEYDRAVWLVEFIEFHRILGVGHFYFYNHTTGPNVHKVLQLYQSMGIVTVLLWQIDVRSQKEIRTEAMFASMNDCLYRTMFSYTYTILIDFDEYIVPRNGSTYAQMMSKYEKQYNIGSFVFQNTFFYLYHENDTNFLNDRSESHSAKSVPYLITLFKTRRTKMINTHGYRSKYMVRPENCLMLGNHRVWIHLPAKKSINIKSEVALSHHYRICENGGYDCLKHPTVFDNSTWHYAEKLLASVADTCQQVFPQTGQCPEAPPLGSPW